jgi:hypothetical protein
VRRSVWAETCSFDDLCRRETLALLGRFGVDVLVAVRPGQERELGRALAACAEAGVRAGAWPMLGDADGRWASASNADKFAGFAREIADALERDAVPLASFAVDLEPSFGSMDKAAHGILGAARGALRGLVRRSTREAPASVLAKVTEELSARGAEVTLAVLPLVAWDRVPPHEPRWQARLGTPVDALTFGRASAMVYTSLLEGWSRRLLSRADTRALLADAARAMRARFGARASLSLGCVGTGAFANEPVYCGPEELADDVAVARASGIEDLVMFDLGGALRRQDAPRWLEALVHAEPAPSAPPPTLASRAAVLAARWGARV